MSPADLLAAVILFALVTYALLGGADFGGGVWDLLASGPRKKAQRELIEHAIGPIWEANHVWLILAVVVLFSAFPSAFAAVSITLFAPLVLLLAGIVLRGAAFTFRAYDDRGDRVQERWGLVFSASSVLAPLLLGVTVGALASGRLRVGDDLAPASGPWAALSPFTVATGLLACALFAFLAATYLAVEADDASRPRPEGAPRRRQREDRSAAQEASERELAAALREDFRRRAFVAAVAVGVLAAATAALSYRGAPLVFRGLTSKPWSIALHLATGVAAVLALFALARHRLRLARLAAAAQVALIVLGWGAAQYPWMVAPDVTIASASGPRTVQVALLWALAAGAVTLVPSLFLLFRVFKGERSRAV